MPQSPCCRIISSAPCLKQAAALAAAACAVAALLAPGAARAAPTDEELEEQRLEPNYVGGKKAVAAKDWATAIRLLSFAALRDTRNADIQNLLGYAHRNSGELALAFEHYARALQLNPRHRGAHEYLGEAYLMVKNLAQAEEHLAALRGICQIPCEEYDQLEKKIGEYRARAGPQ